MTAYIKSKDGIPIEDWMFSAYLGFNHFGLNIILFEEIEEVPCKKDIILVSYIDETQKWFKKMGWIENPQLPSIPFNEEFYNLKEIKKGDHLYNFKIKMKDVRDNKFEYPFFMKSVGLKEFIPTIISNRNVLDYQDLSKIDDNCHIQLFPVIKNIESEWRVYVIDNEIVKVCNYLGNSFYNDVFHFKSYIFGIICMFQFCFPDRKTYSLDIAEYVGEKEEYNYELIEYNDFWSLGNYGLSPKEYALGLLRRWKEIIIMNKNIKI